MDENIIELINQDGVMEKYMHIDTIDLDDNQYVMLEPYYEKKAPLEYEYTILRIDNIDGEETLTTIEDEEEFQKVIEAFRELLADEYDID